MTGRIISMGLLCGVFGINVAHELGHRVNRFEQFLAKSLLLTSQYIHFFIEHNKGHHKM
jgi:alkane 1-monooxygenase